jgi:polysaccharide chain length determinant protein (PEP-CTERM system associated)
MNFDFAYAWAVFLRRLHYFVIITTLVSAAAIAAAVLLPPSYSANSTLLVESSQIPNALAAPTVQTGAMEQLQIIEQRLMTRANLLDIANRLNALPEMKNAPADEVVEAMRNNTWVTKRAGPNQATIMNIGFFSDSGQTAAAVVNEYVTLILKANVEIRTERAGETLEFFEQEVKSLSAELDAASAKILDFQNKNADALPNTLNFRLNQQAMLQQQIAQADRDVAALEDQKERLVAVFNTTGQVNNAGVQQTPEAQQLAQAKDQLTQALAVMSPENPKVKLLQARVAQLEEIVLAQAPADGSQAAVPANPAETMLNIQLADIDSRIEALLGQKKLAEDQLAKITDTIDRTSGNQVELDALTRDYQNIQQQYNVSVDRLSKAATGERIELLSKGERITLIDAAVVPSKPDKPNRVLIAGGGVFGGMGLGIAAIILMELLNRSVRRPKDLVRAFGITPLATIPYVRTPRETILRRTAFASMLMVAIVGIPAAIYAVHVFYQPLDLILSRFATQFGISL